MSIIITFLIKQKFSCSYLEHFIVDLFLLTIYFVLFMQSLLRSSRKPPLLGLITGILIIVCIFRICFMFMYPNEVFDGNQLAEIIVFELPTFFLFTLCIIAIFFWQKMTQKATFRSNYKLITVTAGLGIAFVWSLWIIVIKILVF
jgi:hypothetical protein